MFAGICLAAVVAAARGAEQGRCVAHPDLPSLVTIQALEGGSCDDLVRIRFFAFFSVSSLFSASPASSFLSVAVPPSA